MTKYYNIPSSNCACEIFINRAACHERWTSGIMYSLHCTSCISGRTVPHSKARKPPAGHGGWSSCCQWAAGRLCSRSIAHATASPCTHTSSCLHTIIMYPMHHHVWTVLDRDCILTSTKDILAAIASCGKVVIMAVGTVELLILGGKGLVDQRVLAVTALEAFLVPVFLLVGQILQQTDMNCNALLSSDSQFYNLVWTYKEDLHNGQML